MALTKEDIQTIAVEMAAIDEARQEIIRRNSLLYKTTSAGYRIGVKTLAFTTDRLTIGLVIGIIAGVFIGVCLAPALSRNKSNTVPKPVTLVTPPNVTPIVKPVVKPLDIDADVKTVLRSVISEVLQNEYETPAELREAVRDELQKKKITIPNSLQEYWKNLNLNTPNTLEAVRAAYTTFSETL
ncbi:MAG: hypothetical protein LBT46_15455 [Planctomycetaceae bacterium]|jgi:hypothetical protein|nr:hypothetical protein [Planctomycetaceae bacterium]